MDSIDEIRELLERKDYDGEISISGIARGMTYNSILKRYEFFIQGEDSFVYAVIQPSVKQNYLEGLIGSILKTSSEADKEVLFFARQMKNDSRWPSGLMVYRIEFDKDYSVMIKE